jgi:dihydroorotate dehydrogenase
MYALIRKLLFLWPAEKAHYFAMNSLKLLCSMGLGGLIKRLYSFEHKALVSEHWGLLFKNPVGLGAGFDKNARYLRELACLGFGFVEIGTVTPLPQQGNEKPRLFRLPADKALVNRMGFNNDGMDVIASRLKAWRSKPAKAQQGLIVGGNIGKNKNTPNELAWQDYEKCFVALHAYVDYFVVNVSSPNTPGLRALQDKESLRKIFEVLEAQNQKLPARKPILLKIAPDLNQAQVDDVVALAFEINLDGLVVSNTTIDRAGLQTPAEKVTAIGAGGLSGLPLRQKAAAMCQDICKKTAARVPVIASGGIFTAADAQERLNAGAVLVQVWTAFIYEGPGIARKICKEMGN